MATSSCANCIFLTKQCLELKEEVANLTLKLDNNNNNNLREFKDST